ncbi:phosphopantetheine-binding protein, partial [Catenovulum sediminis]
RNKLATYEVTQVQAEYVAPRNATEKQLCEIWQSVLGIEQVGIYDNFFDLGGHSLLAVKALTMGKQKYDINLEIKDMFECENIADLSQLIDEININKNNNLLKETVSDGVEVEW